MHFNNNSNRVDSLINTTSSVNSPSSSNCYNNMYYYPPTNNTNKTKRLPSFAEVFQDIAQNTSSNTNSSSSLLSIPLGYSNMYLNNNQYNFSLPQADPHLLQYGYSNYYDLNSKEATSPYYALLSQKHTASSTPKPANNNVNFSFVDMSEKQKDLKNKKKRLRRRHDEINRVFRCSYNKCQKSYGTLNNLNAHIIMQKHGSKKSAHEFNVTKF